MALQVKMMILIILFLLCGSLKLLQSYYFFADISNFFNNVLRAIIFIEIFWYAEICCLGKVLMSAKIIGHVIAIREEPILKGSF